MTELSYEASTALLELHRIIEDHSQALVDILRGAPTTVAYPPTSRASAVVQLSHPIGAADDVALDSIVKDRMAAAFFEWLNVLDGTHDPEVLDGGPWLGLEVRPAGDNDRPMLHDAFMDSWHDFVATRPIE